MGLKFVVTHLWHHPSNRGRRLRTLLDALSWQVRKRLVKTPREITVYGGLRMRCHPDSGGSAVMIYSSAWPDYDEMHFISRVLRPGQAVIDVGANVGVYTLLAASAVGKTGRVLAFEAAKRPYEMLCENIALNELDFVEARFAAIGREEGQIEFLQGRGLMNRVTIDGEDVSGEATMVVPSTTLDHALDAPFALGKIDVEGAEPLVFAGAEASLRAGNPPVWILELKEKLLRRFDWTADRFAQVFEDADYRFGVYDADANELSFPPQPWQGRDNVIAVYEPAIPEIRARLAEPGLVR